MSSHNLESQLYPETIDPADEIPEVPVEIKSETKPPTGIEYEPETKPTASPEATPDLPSQIKACRQQALDQFLALIDAYLLELIKQNPYAVTVDINKSYMTKRAGMGSFVPPTLFGWIQNLMRKHFDAFGIKIEFNEAHRNFDWGARLTLPSL